jgi:hypothetical protein
VVAEEGPGERGRRGGDDVLDAPDVWELEVLGRGELVDGARVPREARCE